MSKDPYSSTPLLIATSTHRPACKVFRLGEPLVNEMPELNISYKSVHNSTMVTIENTVITPTMFLSKTPVAVLYPNDWFATVTYLEMNALGEKLCGAIVTRCSDAHDIPEVPERVIYLDGHAQPASMAYDSKICQALRAARTHHTIGWQRCAALLMPGTLELAKPVSYRNSSNNNRFLHHLFFGLIGIDSNRFFNQGAKGHNPTFSNVAAAIVLWETKRYENHTPDDIAKIAALADKLIGSKTMFDEPPFTSPNSLEEYGILEHLQSHGILSVKRRKVRNSLAYKNVYQLTELGLWMRELFSQPA